MLAALALLGCPSIGAAALSFANLAPLFNDVKLENEGDVGALKVELPTGVRCTRLTT